jgi:hypothetical protein
MSWSIERPKAFHVPGMQESRIYDLGALLLGSYDWAFYDWAYSYAAPRCASPHHRYAALSAMMHYFPGTIFKDFSVPPVCRPQCASQTTLNSPCASTCATAINSRDEIREVKYVQFCLFFHLPLFRGSTQRDMARLLTTRTGYTPWRNILRLLPY